MGGAGAREPEDDEGRDHLLVAHLGVLRDPVDDPEPVDEVADDLRLHRHRPDLAELRLGVQRVDVAGQALTEGVAAEVGEPRLLARGLDQTLVVQLAPLGPQGWVRPPRCRPGS